MSRRNYQPAFTLVELLVVIAIIGILIALLLPAVQAAREAARRTQCINNLKQVSLAIHSHIDTLKTFPTGGSAVGSARTLRNGRPVSYTEQAWSWPYQILPQIEQQNLYDNPVDRFVYSTPIEMYYCPSRRPPIAIGAGPWQFRPIPTAMTDYAGNAGYPDPNDNDPDLNKRDRPNFTATPMLGKGKNGVFRVNFIYPLPLAIRSISDGMSQTILIGEKRLNSNFVLTENQPGDNDGYVGGFQDDVVRWGYYEPAPDWSGPQLLASQLHPNNYQFGGPHPGVFIMAFCDGSVHTMRYDVTLDAFRAMCIRNDGVVVSDGDNGL